jgi:hypothetical protein
VVSGVIVDRKPLDVVDRLADGLKHCSNRKFTVLAEIRDDRDASRHARRRTMTGEEVTSFSVLEPVTEPSGRHLFAKRAYQGAGQLGENYRRPLGTTFAHHGRP